QKSGRLLSFASMPSPKATTGPIHHTPASTLPTKDKQLQALLGTSHIQTQNKLDAREAAFLQTLSSPSSAQAGSFSTPTQNAPSPRPTPQLQTIQPEPAHSSQQPDKPTAESLTQREAALTQQLEQAKKEEATEQTPTSASVAHQKATDLEKQIQTIHEQKQQLEKE